ncbi:ATP-dependent DNA helicase [Nocardioides sp. CFH 31398]|uniref:ATP-dependent helicase n=1 Tax=Nocardioides sp. CFH 31398 TaxID=2919579 RepID=UPI001F069AF3|nr:ATP-dependent DNA helicase [Nocardioides sp. CFH 31398]MCH1866500.1 ATP-dependent helicase [Nocardioides sp. CFH 31398]
MPEVSPTYRLVPPAPPPPAPVLDDAQRAVVEHPGGPLLVLAGPGTGKTTTMVEAIVDRVAGRGSRPEEVLALTFSRKAADQLRDRVQARLARTTSTRTSWTFHSYAFALVRRYAPDDLYAAEPRLLSAPEQDVVIAELLADHPESVTWPAHLRAALGTRGFVREVQAVLARALERTLEPGDLVDLAEVERSPELAAAGRFLDQYLSVLALRNAVGYADLVARATAVAEEHRDEIRAGLRHVFVDEYQDTDPAQVALLRAVAGDGRDLVVVGDPDQSIYGFRGADVRGILDFPAAFPAANGDPADVVALGTTRRFGSRLLKASRRVVGGIPLTGAIPEQARTVFRHPAPAASAAEELGHGSVEVLTFDTPRAESEHLADLLRRAHLEDGLAWSDMAVLVRSGRSSIPGLRRSLAASGVPVDVASDETPLADEAPVQPLLRALRVVVADDDAHEGPDGARAQDGLVDAATEHAEELLTSPLGGLDATDVRALLRALRARDPRLASAGLLRAVVLDPALTADLPGEAARRAHRLARLVATAREQDRAGATAEEVLWTLWDGVDWGRRLRRATETGGHAARLAHRDLDAICALFETAARDQERRGRVGAAGFLETLRAQRIPGDTLAERGVRGGAVRLLTAHRSKGLEWRLVVVAGVQEERWPDVRRRDSLLGADRIGGPEAGGLLPPPLRRALLAEERRLFYVAVTRARQRLVVTAVASPDDDGDQPSRFLGELDVPVVHRVGRPRRPLSLPGLVAELRRTCADPEAPEPLRAAAARRLARLASAEHAGRPLAASADPATWWGLRAPSRADVPVRPDDEPLVVSASTLEGLLTCPAQWFLHREAGGEEVSSASQGFGQVVHGIAERYATAEGDLDVETDLMPLVDEVWDRMDFRTPWSAARERAEVQAALERFVAWTRAPGARRVVATEPRLRAEVELPGGERIRLHGYADRLELDEDGAVVVVDLKTGKYPPTKAEVVVHPQLGLYQLAVEQGAVDDVLGEPARSGGAELVQLRHGGDLPRVQQQPATPPGEEPVVLGQLARAAAALRDEDFPARPGTHCDRCAFHAVCPDKTAGSVLS